LTWIKKILAVHDKTILKYMDWIPDTPRPHNEPFQVMVSAYLIAQLREVEDTRLRRHGQKN